jgi:hypothetical protein
MNIASIRAKTNPTELSLALLTKHMGTAPVLINYYSTKWTRFPFDNI